MTEYFPISPLTSPVSHLNIDCCGLSCFIDGVMRHYHQMDRSIPLLSNLHRREYYHQVDCPSLRILNVQFSISYQVAPSNLLFSSKLFCVDCHYHHQLHRPILFYTLSIFAIIIIT
uniref:Uncharacterized protein n=1 Tax=Spongospora subterranea TaxID=70186 RepID=A0A0H5QY94_9EUKA|eukprot:CRZ06621.1 hypothetical protein [Spongospora subterranea]